MKRRDFLLLAGAAAVAPAWPIAGTAQVLAKIPRVALASGAVPPLAQIIGGDPAWSAFITEMARLGFVEGRTVTYERYLAPATQAGASARLILETAPDVIFLGAAATTAIAMTAINKTIPMVVQSADLFYDGIVSNVSRPGGNVTGVSGTTGPDEEARNLSALFQAVPAAKTVAYIQSGTGGKVRSPAEPLVSSITKAASELGVSVTVIVVEAAGGQAEMSRAFQEIAARKLEAVQLGRDATVMAQSEVLADLARAARLPAISPYDRFVQAGGLLAYGSNSPDNYRKAAGYVALLLKGSNPGELPVLQPTNFDLAINLKTARAIGVTIPPALLAQATQIIE
jgi:putative ABC transport system substrate-binding protein